MNASHQKYTEREQALWNMSIMKTTRMKKNSKAEEKGL
jgi:hypothetical protein